MRPAAANRIAFTVIAVAFVALALVLGLWQRVDAACEGATPAVGDPSACGAPGEVEQSAPAVGLPFVRR